MAEARFAQIQPQIAIFASPIHYKCMSIGIRELLRVVMTTTSNEGFLMNKMSFLHLFEMVMIFEFHGRGIFNKGRNGGKSSKTHGKRTATTTNAGHGSIRKSMSAARFARIQPQITMFVSLIHYESMSIGIRELLRAVMTTTSNEGFFMNKMSFVHLFEMVMIFYFHSRGIFNKGKKMEVGLFIWRRR
uniref:Uncharacterized protein n=1 Tax=Vitis vinifera TaxID=29760 RepID=A5BWM4_VITVI|nr:hypothetical protein VITISV_017776 [Vitis vinifera]